MIGAISGTGEIIYHIQDTKANIETFDSFLDYFHHSSCYKPLHVILDNARYHKNKGVLEKVKKMGMKFYFQPFYSPFLNVAEEIWRQLREFLRGRFFYNLKNLKFGIMEFFIENPILNVKLARYLD